MILACSPALALVGIVGWTAAIVLMFGAWKLHDYFFDLSPKGRSMFDVEDE